MNVLICDTKLVCRPMGLYRHDDIEPPLHRRCPFSLLCVLDEVVKSRPWWKDIGLYYLWRILAEH